MFGVEVAVEVGGEDALAAAEGAAFAEEPVEEAADLVSALLGGGHDATREVWPPKTMQRQTRARWYWLGFTYTTRIWSPEQIG